MIELLRKEINIFFSSLIGYLIIGLFLLISGLFLWVVKSDFNILDFGYANMDPFFMLSPIIFLVFTPAIGMRMLSEEFRTGTIELLLTKPISTIQLVVSKFIAILVLLVITILPTAIYVCSIYYLGETVGNLDIGGVLGAYIGLFFLCGVYAAISVFSSSVTSNQIIAFLLAIILNITIYYGFELLATIEGLQSIDLIIKKMGISYHFEMMSKGVISTDDIVYFLSVIFLFVKLTEFVIINKNR